MRSSLITFFSIVRPPATCALRNAFFSRFGLSWVILRRVIDLFAYWWTASSTQCACVEDGKFMSFMMYLEEKEWYEF
jgi:hypothetical protein